MKTPTTRVEFSDWSGRWSWALWHYPAQPTLRPTVKYCLAVGAGHPNLEDAKKGFRRFAKRTAIAAKYLT